MKLFSQKFMIQVYVIYRLHLLKLNKVFFVDLCKFMYQNKKKRRLIKSGISLGLAHTI